MPYVFDPRETKGSVRLPSVLARLVCRIRPHLDYGTHEDAHTVLGAYAFPEESPSTSPSTARSLSPTQRRALRKASGLFVLALVLVLCASVLVLRTFGTHTTHTDGNVQTCWVESNADGTSDYYCGSQEQARTSSFVRWALVKPNVGNSYQLCEEDDVLVPRSYSRTQADYVCENAEQYVQRNASMLSH
jgi:hypothetical protein